MNHFSTVVVPVLICQLVDEKWRVKRWGRGSAVFAENGNGRACMGDENSKNVPNSSREIRIISVVKVGEVM